MNIHFNFVSLSCYVNLIERSFYYSWLINILKRVLFIYFSINSIYFVFLEEVKNRFPEIKIIIFNRYKHMFCNGSFYACPHIDIILFMETLRCGESYYYHYVVELKNKLFHVKHNKHSKKKKDIINLQSRYLLNFIM